VVEGSDLAAYLAEHYGECELGSGRCYHGPGPRCLSQGWRGAGCRHWKPTTATTWDELKVEVQSNYKTR
jgi:hypothetical protein